MQPDGDRTGGAIRSKAAELRDLGLDFVTREGERLFLRREDLRIETLRGSVPARVTAAQQHAGAPIGIAPAFGDRNGLVLAQVEGFGLRHVASLQVDGKGKGCCSAWTPEPVRLRRSRRRVDRSARYPIL